MADSTVNLGLPLVAAAQAQKHVTVNEAFARLDALGRLRLESIDLAQPPDPVPDGSAWAVPAGAVNAWAGQEGKLALGLNGGWTFLPPWAGMRVWIADRSEAAIWDGSQWVLGAATLSAHGAVTIERIVEFEHVITAGASNQTSVVIPSGTQVIGVTGRVIEAITGSLGAWSLGVSGGVDRYGSGLGLAVGSWVRGLTSSPLTYWADTPLELTAEGGSFAGGRVRLAIHLRELVPPGL